MPAINGFVDFDPAKHIGSLAGKVIFITGGTTGLGRTSLEAFAAHNPAHIYFTGRNATAATSLIAAVNKAHPAVGLTFVKVDMLSLAAVKSTVSSSFTHDRLDILMCNAGIMATPPALSKDGFEQQFAINHLAHAMVTRVLLPVLVRTAEQPGSDVRIVNLTSLGYMFHPKGGVDYKRVRTVMDGIMGPWVRYGQSKVANILYTRHLAKLYPFITSVSIHPGVVQTELVNNLSIGKKMFTYGANWIQGIQMLDPERGCHNQVWAAAGARKEELRNGGFYEPIAVDRTDKLTSAAKDLEIAEKLWTWTEEVLDKF